MTKKNEGQAAGGTAVAGAAAPAGQFSAVRVARKTEGLQRTADRGIRMHVVGMILAAGAAGQAAGELQKAWGDRNGSLPKVQDCMGILAGDSYGYPVERLSHPTDKSLDKYRFTPGVSLTPKQAPAGAAQGGNAGAPAAGGHNPPPLAEAMTDVGLAEMASKQGDPKEWIKENVPANRRNGVRASLKALLAASPS